MIQSLYIRNYILIEELKIEFGRDLHVLTGETGAGKSIILGAIGLIAGERADSNSMMEEEKKCIIELTVDIDESYRDFFKTEDIDFEKETIIRREIKPGGKSRAFINDTPVRLNQLKALTSGLLTIHQQFDTHQIGKEKYQLFILDEFGGHTKLIEAYKAQYRQYNELKKRKKEIETTLTAWNREREFNDFLLQELNELDPSQQDEELEKEVALLENAESIHMGLMKLAHQISGGENDWMEPFREGVRLISDLSFEDQRLNQFRERLENVVSDVEELERDALDLAEEVVYDEQKLEAVRSRLDELIRLQRKHQVDSIEELLQLKNELGGKMGDMDSMEQELANTEVALKKSLEDLEESAIKLSEARKKVAIPLTKAWIQHLRSMAMPNVRMEFSFSETEDYGPNGQDLVQLLVAVNKGAQLQKLDEVASGGERSRMSLAINAILSRHLEVNTLIFDEIDTGVSGEVSAKMGELLREISQFRQVICISHSPQIAALAKHHYRVYKRDLEDRTQTNIELLTADGRIEEIAGMLSSKEKSEAAIANAKALLEGQ